MPAEEYKQRGLFAKYNVERNDEQPLDDGERLFVLRYDKDDEYGRLVRKVLLESFVPGAEALGYRKLAADLKEDIARVEARISAKTTGRVPVAIPPL